jgi:hypothetical protein
MMQLKQQQEHQNIMQCLEEEQQELEQRLQEKLLLYLLLQSAFMYKLHYNARPLGLSSANTTTYLSLNFGNGLLYACLVEAFSYLKGPMDMLQLYEQKYQTEVQKFGGEQLGRRRRDDYTDKNLVYPFRLRHRKELKYGNTNSQSNRRNNTKQ